jgi:hypothetical protein
MIEVLEQYNIRFTNHKIFGYEIKGFMSNSPKTVLESFTTDWCYTKDDIDKFISDVEAVLIGESSQAGGISQGLFAGIVTPTKTKFYEDYTIWANNNNATPDFELPTTDFKVILEAWRDYLANG